LFFLSPGILFGFKKPVLFLPFDQINSVSYTSIVQRTFNLNVTAQDPITGEESEIEFAMVDQADFAGIDTYIKRHGLNDASLAADRRAKVYNVNGPKGAAAAAEADTTMATNGDEPHAENGADGEETEIQRAERLLQDAEDEDEEDYVDEEEDYEEGSSDEEYDGDGGEGEVEYEEGDEGGEEGEEGDEVFQEEEEYEGEAGGYEDE
jgi:hypothetical protein